MLKCRDVPAEASLALDNELSRRRTMALRFHILMCRHCHRYMRQARLLAQAWTNRGEAASEDEVNNVMQACRDNARKTNSEDV